MRNISRQELKFASLWLVMLVLAAWLSSGWLQPDEHARVLEPAHALIYQYGSLPWELAESPPIVSWLLGFLMAPLFWFTKLAGASGLTEAFLARLITGVIASTRLIAMYRLLGEFRLNRKRYSLYLLITGFGIFGPYMFVRTSQENYATTALLWALVLHFDVLRHPKSWRYVSCFAALLALATSFRLQAGPAAAALGIYTLVKTGPQIIPASVFGLIQGLLPLAIVDTITADGPFLPAWNYLLYALGDEQGGHLWGTSPWWFYLQEYFNTWYPPLSPFLIPLLWLGLRGSPALAAIILPFTFIHFGLGHKETRYFSPMIPFMQLAMFVGWEQLERIKPHLTERILEWQKSLKTLLYLFVGVGFMGSLIALNTSPTMYDELGKMIRAGKITQFTYLGNTRSPPSQFYMKTPELGPVPRLSYDEILDEGKVIPAGWLALYAAGPVIYGKIDSQCDIVYVSIAPWQQWLLSILPPKTPIRRRVNAIVHCDAPIHIERKRNQH